MKKIGIITFHRANNYGAVLQCYALQEILIILGYDVKVVDYRQPYIELLYNPIRYDIICRHILNIRVVARYVIKDFWRLLIKRIKYDIYRNKYLKTTGVINRKEQIPQDIDVYVIGSDQLWNPEVLGDKFEDVYMGAFPHSPQSVIVGYAISSNVIALQNIRNDVILKAAANFDILSFRENKLGDYIADITGRDVRIDIDPTLLLDRSKWELCVKKRPINRKYLLTYFLHGNVKKSELRKIINTFSQKMGYKVVDVLDVAFSPIEFLTLVYYADYVVTSSFHAVVFSLIFNKEFFAINSHNGREERYRNLMEKVGVFDRCIDAENINNIVLSKIDYSVVNEKLLSLRNDSIQFLSSL